MASKTNARNGAGEVETEPATNGSTRGNPCSRAGKRGEIYPRRPGPASGSGKGRAVVNFTRSMLKRELTFFMGTAPMSCL